MMDTARGVVISNVRSIQRYDGYGLVPRRAASLSDSELGQVLRITSLKTRAEVVSFVQLAKRPVQDVERRTVSQNMFRSCTFE